MLSVVDVEEDRLLYLAETGLGMTEAPRDIKLVNLRFCSA